MLVEAIASEAMSGGQTDRIPARDHDGAGRVQDARASHARLMGSSEPLGDAGDEFDRHVVACLLAVAFEEAGREGTDPTDALGLSGSRISALLGCCFPHFERGRVGPFAGAPDVEMEEELLIGLLADHLAPFDEAGNTKATSHVSRELRSVLPRVIARRAMRPDHLWQDLGLCDRGELNRLLARHFPTLHAGNTGNMRWKKYFYRRLCEAEGFSLCTAPSCAACTDFTSCFGEEDGQSRLASVRRSTDLGTAHPLG